MRQKTQKVPGSLTKEEIRARLLAARAQLKGNVQAHRDGIKHGVGETDVTDTYEKADMDVVRVTASTLLQTGTATLRQINDAIARLEAGTYAVCTDCEMPIPDVRMVAQPWAERCRDCQEAVENGTRVVDFASGTRLGQLREVDGD